MHVDNVGLEETCKEREPPHQTEKCYTSTIDASTHEVSLALHAALR